jgi:hypothetical protein
VNVEVLGADVGGENTRDDDGDEGKGVGDDGEGMREHGECGGGDVLTTKDVNEGSLHISTR